MELSLEDIIKLKRTGKQSNSQKMRILTNTDNNASGPRRNLNGRVNTSPRLPPKARGNTKLGSKPVDARLKIIQKNRQRLGDARDKLAELAKQTDARTKIKGRKMNIQNGRHGQDTRGGIGFRPIQNVRYQTPPLLQRSIKNNVVASLRDPSSMIRCTINRPAADFPRSYGEEMDIDEPLSIRRHNDFSGIQVALKNEFTHYARQEYVPSREHYTDTHESPVFRTMESSRSIPRIDESRRMSLEMRARLDTPARPQRPPSSSPPPSQPLGHRIVVSNLHSSVTHEDIKELFEDIGPLITSRLVRAGTAEVIYKFYKDAKKAVEAYHNRQLDGQPMKCLLVNSRPTTSSSSGVLRSNNMPATNKFPSSSKSMVVPDLSAIHKALFTTK